MKLKWLQIREGGYRVDGPQFVWRTKVPGGWFVFVHRAGEEAGAFFYPDPNHEWDGNSLP